MNKFLYTVSFIILNAITLLICKFHLEIFYSIFLSLLMKCFVNIQVLPLKYIFYYKESFSEAQISWWNWIFMFTSLLSYVVIKPGMRKGLLPLCMLLLISQVGIRTVVPHRAVSNKWEKAHGLTVEAQELGKRQFLLLLAKITFMDLSL